MVDKIETTDVIIDDRMTTTIYRITPKYQTRKKYKLDPFYTVDVYTPALGDVSYTVFDMFGNMVVGKEKEVVLDLFKKAIEEDKK